MTTTQAFRDLAYPSDAPSDVPLLLLIESDELADPIRLSNAGGTWDDDVGGYVFTALGASWICAAFEVDLPGQADEEPEARLKVPAVDQRIGAALDAITSPARCTIWAVLEAEPDTIVGGPHSHLLLQEVEGDALTITGTLRRAHLTTEPWPKEWIRPAKFRAAFRAVQR